MKIPNKLFGFLLIAGLVACSGGGSDQAMAQVVEDLEPAAFQSTYAEKGGNLIDVRTPGETAEGLLEGAQEINIQDQDFRTRIGALDKDKPVFVYCKAGGRSARAAGILEELGFSEVYNLDGGITAWGSAGLPIVQKE